MSGYCKDCGNQLCVCDNGKEHYELRKAKQLVRDRIMPNPEDLEWKDVNDVMPVKEQKYLTYPHYLILDYIYNAFYSDMGKEYVSHWIYLPRPPKGVE